MRGRWEQDIEKLTAEREVFQQQLNHERALATNASATESQRRSEMQARSASARARAC